MREKVHMEVSTTRLVGESSSKVLSSPSINGAEDEAMLREGWHCERDWAFHPPFRSKRCCPGNEPTQDGRMTCSRIRHRPVARRRLAHRRQMTAGLRYVELRRNVPLLLGDSLSFWRKHKLKKTQGQTADLVAGVDVERSFQEIAPIKDGCV